jgi:hypothetical protein
MRRNPYFYHYHIPQSLDIYTYVVHNSKIYIYHSYYLNFLEEYSSSLFIDCIGEYLYIYMSFPDAGQYCHIIVSIKDYVLLHGTTGRFPRSPVATKRPDEDMVKHKMSS